MRVVQKFCNILVCASLQHVYHMTEADTSGYLFKSLGCLGFVAYQPL